MRLPFTSSIAEDEALREWWQKCRHGKSHAIKILITFLVPALTFPAFYFFAVSEFEDIESSGLGLFGPIIFSAVLSLVLLLFTILPVWGARSAAAAAIANSRRYERHMIKKARRTARSLGPKVVPVLTKEHVHARKRVENAFRGSTAVWTRQEAENICKLLFEDFDREEKLILLMDHRGLTTFEQIKDATDEIESAPKALQSGWL